VRSGGIVSWQTGPVASTKECAFCWRTGSKVTKEHVVPRWVSKLLLTDPALEVEHTVGYGYQYPRRSKELDMQVRAVCGSCNHGWMGEMEAGVKAVLADPIVGRLSEPIPAKKHKLLAMWAVKTWLLTMHADARPPGNPPFPLQREVFGRLYRTRMPPDAAAVWIGALNPVEIAHYGVIHRIGTLMVERPVGTLVGMTGILTIGCVQLIVYMAARNRLSETSSPDLHMMTSQREAEPYLSQLWPSAGAPIPWPPGDLLCVTDIDRFWPDNKIFVLEVP
jgi:hypothetical protein